MDIGRQLADLYEDFYQSSKNFEKKFNDRDYLKETEYPYPTLSLKKEDIYTTMLIHLIFIL